MTSQQLQALKTYIVGQSDLSPLTGSADGRTQIASMLSAIAVPDFWVWRTSVSQQEIVTTTTEDGTAWSWPAFIARSQGERDGWREMFADTGYVNGSLANVRQGFADIFSGSTGVAVAQRTHLLTVARRRASRAEKLLASGTGTTAAPAVMAYEGTVSFQDVDSALNLP